MKLMTYHGSGANMSEGGKIQQWEKDIYLNRGKTEDEIYHKKKDEEESIIRSIEVMEREMREKEHENIQSRPRQESTTYQHKEIPPRNTNPYNCLNAVEEHPYIEETNREFNLRKDSSFARRGPDQDEVGSLINNIVSPNDITKHRDEEIRIRMTGSEVYEYPMAKKPSYEVELNPY